MSSNTEEQFSRVARGLFDQIANSFSNNDPLSASGGSSVLSRYSNQNLQGAATNGNLGIFGAYGGHGMFGGTDCFTIDICPDFLLAAFAAAAAAAFWLIYTAITQNPGRRKKRSALQNLGQCIYTFGKKCSLKLCLKMILKRCMFKTRNLKAPNFPPKK